MKFIQNIVLASMLLFALSGLGQDIPDPMSPPRLVNDYTGILNENQFRHLEMKLERFNDSSSTQIVVALVKSLNGLTKEEFADQLGEKWGVGQKGKNNGIVILIKPHYQTEKGEVWISVGYGLEGIIPDAIAKRIVENDMMPYFKADDYYGGIEQATNTIISLAKGEFSAEQYKKKTAGSPFSYAIPIIIIILIIIFMRGNSGNHYTTGSKGSSIWTALFLGSMLGGRGGSGSWGDFRSGGGSFGGGGGGGFGGFGGGSFGGGGAGGSW